MTQGKMRACEYGFLSSPLKPPPLTTDTASSKPSAPQLMTRAKTPSKQTLMGQRRPVRLRIGDMPHTQLQYRVPGAQSLGLRGLIHTGQYVLLWPGLGATQGPGPGQMFFLAEMGLNPYLRTSEQPGLS